MNRIAIFISGRGSNMQAILERIKKKDLPCQCVFVFSDNKEAKGLEIAKKYGIETISFTVKECGGKIPYEERLKKILLEKKIDFVVCAGYLKIVGPTLLKAFPYRFINIHPSLLPAFPGLKAQKQALNYGVRFSGCTVHFMDEGIDTGPIIAQAICEVKENDTEETLSRRILKLEHELYWRALKQVFQGYKIEGRKVIFKK